METDTEATEDDPYSAVFIVHPCHGFRDVSWMPELAILSVLSALIEMTIALQIPMSIL